MWSWRASAALLLIAMQAALAGAQVRPTSTPISASLVTPTPQDLQLAPTLTPLPTATPPGPAVLQARESAGNVNVRQAPDTNSALLGTISFGDWHPLLRRYYLWYELRYDPSPSGRAWVFSELVELDGELSEVIEITDFADIADTGQDLAAPDDGGGTVDDAGDARVLILSPGADEQVARETGQPATPLPTFTYAPDQPAFAPTLAASVDGGDGSGRVALPLTEVPPIVPILALAALGAVGWLISWLRG